MGELDELKLNLDELDELNYQKEGKIVEGAALTSYPLSINFDSNSA